MQARKKVGALAAVTSVLVVTGIAYALWTADGIGSGDAKAKTEKAVTLAAGGASDQLYPGANGDVVIKIHNPNPYNVVINSVSHGALSGTDGITSGNTTCDAGNGLTYNHDSSWNSTTPTALTGVVVAANGDYALTIKNALAMDNSVVDACSGKTFTVPVGVAAQSDTTSSPGTASNVVLS